MNEQERMPNWDDCELVLSEEDTVATPVNWVKTLPGFQNTFDTPNAPRAPKRLKHSRTCVVESEGTNIKDLKLSPNDETDNFEGCPQRKQRERILAKKEANVYGLHDKRKYFKEMKDLTSIQILKRMTR